jgi:mono/diheme cytochrome c family protein
MLRQLAITLSFSIALTAHDPGTAAEEPRLPKANTRAGLDSYLANCAACHQTNGEGLAGVFPPLKGSGVVNKGDAAKHIQIVLKGIQGARAGGVVYAADMPPFARLSDAEIAALVNYERSAWGNHGPPVTAAQVAVERGRAK